MESKNLELLRPFDLEAAKRGEAVIDCDGDEAKYIAGPHQITYEIVVDAMGGLGFLMAKASDLRMAPLCWVEGRPVYKGDRPWNKIDGKQYTVTRFCQSTEVLQTVEERSDGIRSLCIEDATWTQPKVKREGWVNIYSTTVDGGLRGTSVVYPSEELANERADNNRLACARIECEEPAA